MTDEYEPGWLAEELRKASASVAAFVDASCCGDRLPSAYTDQQLLDSIELLKQRLREQEGEAHRRGLLT